MNIVTLERLMAETGTSGKTAELLALANAIEEARRVEFAKKVTDVFETLAVRNARYPEISSTCWQAVAELRKLS